MNIILQAQVPHLGEVGDIVRVKPGYFRNFLMPRGLAVLSTPEAEAELAAKKADIQAAEAAQRQAAQALAEQLEGVTVTLEVQTAKAGKMFGSVKAVDLQQALEAKGHVVSRQAFKMPKGDIHEAGEYAVPLHLHHDVHVDLKV